MESNIAYCLLIEEGEPSTLQEALNNPDASFWKEAMQEEIEALHKNKTWELVPLPGGRKFIGNKWVYKIKRNNDDQVESYRARLVVKGYAQKEGIDFNEIFSPMVRMTTIRVVLEMCATYDLHLEQLDVKTAFLHGNLEEEIYMLQPEGFKQKGKENLVCMLNKSLYGLKQAPRCSTPGEIEMKDLGPANKILGMQIHRDRVSRRIWLSQKSCVKKVLQRFNMQDCKPISTPFPTDVKLSSKMSPSSEKERIKMSRVPYASAVSRYMAKPGRQHWEAMKRILRYVKGTSDVALCFGDSDIIVTGYVDYDYAGDLNGSKLTTGCSSQQRSSMVEDVVGRARYHFVREKVKEGTVDMQKIHIDDSVYHFVREKVKEGTVDMQKIHIDDSVVDYPTKAINCDKFIWCRSSCGLAKTRAT
nr:retrovirus-related Pol polyprotein from transposon TNT 1-94 [Tanacetum cinerariifolium]